MMFRGLAMQSRIVQLFKFWRSMIDLNLQTNLSIIAASAVCNLIYLKSILPDRRLPLDRFGAAVMPEIPDFDVPQVPPRPADGHKGTFGRTLIIAGSRGMSGAACLSGVAALRGGAGLVSVACPVGIQPIVAGYEPGYMTIGLPEGIEGQFSIATLDEISNVVDGNNSVAVGPGLGNSADVVEVVRRVFSEVSVPLVLDADGLNALAASFRDGRWEATEHAGPRILTPHPGEFSRLSGLSISEIEEDRARSATEFAKRNKVILVLKGPGTVVTDGERISINPTGNSGMATGGSGDVLTGLTAALLARGDDPFEATKLAVYLHGLAGDIAAQTLSQPGMIASDLPRYLGAAWKQLLCSSESSST
jgi:ADP-dependent NAD(P)H-hydrate dehydratase